MSDNDIETLRWVDQNGMPHSMRLTAGTPKMEDVVPMANVVRWGSKVFTQVR